MVSSAVVPSQRGRSPSRSYSKRSWSKAARDPGLVSDGAGRTLKDHDEEFRAFLDLWRRYAGWADIAEDVADAISIEMYRGGGLARVKASVEVAGLRKALLMMCIIDTPSVVMAGMITSLDTMAIIAALLLTLAVPLLVPETPAAIVGWADEGEVGWDVARIAYISATLISITSLMLCIMIDMHIRNLLALAHTRESDMILICYHQAGPVVAVSGGLVIGVTLFMFLVVATSYADEGVDVLYAAAATVLVPWAPAFLWFESSSRRHQSHKAFAFGKERGRTAEMHLACLRANVEGEKLLEREYAEKYPSFFPGLQKEEGAGAAVEVG